MPTLTYNGVSSNVIKKADSILNLIHHIIIFRDTNGVICIVLVLRLSLVEQELHTLPEHRSSVPDLSGVRVTRTSVLCVMFCRSLFVLFLMTIVLSVLMDSDYPFGIFKLFIY